ncbi:uncharacterized protein TrAFT101_006922 [Trichoderma asperellum]|uniref:uncharacterized protein n=1 Tax=Trichoderma asperellum TaxID=101201 RepID=UPI00331B1CC4|nr:hypothetical protein TrAFT101_006922 [Trichoderma asperellum]
MAINHRGQQCLEHAGLYREQHSSSLQRMKEKKRKEKKKNHQRGIYKLQIPWQGLTYPVIEALATNNTNPRELYTIPNRRWDFDTIRHMAEDYDLFFILLRYSSSYSRSTRTSARRNWKRIVFLS